MLFLKIITETLLFDIVWEIFFIAKTSIIGHLHQTISEIQSYLKVIILRTVSVFVK